MTDDVTTPPVEVTPAMVPGGPPSYPAALWIGTIDEADLLAGRYRLVGIEGYRTARLLVRSGRLPRGFVELPVADGGIDPAEAQAAVALLPPAIPPAAGERPPISVVLCTFDRPAILALALRSLLDLDYPDYEIVVVDNHPASGLVAGAVRALDDDRIRVVEEARRGLARARNTGLLAARHDVLAFTDDDVIVDRYWLQGIADGFSHGPHVACVTGIVPAGEIGSESQSYFDRRVSWARSCAREVFSLTTVRQSESEPLFPFQVGMFGTGANFALRRDIAVALGGFDEALGVGSPSGGGEDIDMFVRVLLAGHQLAYEPSALVWHRHRADLESLTAQIADYGRGLGAWITKLAVNPRTLPMVARRVVPALRHLRSVTNPEMHAMARTAHESLWRIERRAVLSGPVALARARLSGAMSRPLSSSRRRPDRGPAPR